MASLTSQYHFLEREQHWQHFWEQHKIYKWDPTTNRQDTFAVDTPPPTVSGQLHIGHACSYTQTDFLVRFQRMLGKNIFYPIGFDDNGLPTERLVEKQGGIRAAHVERGAFIRLCQEVIQVEEAKFCNLFKKLALSLDWDLTYQTISPHACKLSQMSFLALLAKGEIYRSQEPILWDPRDGTALAQADIEEKEGTAYMNHILFYHEATQSTLPIATTRPELLPACVALFYHPEDTRYQHLANTYAITPLFAIRVPILADRLVQPDKGTGLVMCCTFGDQTDILWWKQHQLPTTILINKQGIITADHAGPLRGLSTGAARETVIQILTQQQLLTHQVAITQSVKCAERSGAPLEILTMPQWFVRTVAHKEALRTKVDELQWHPPTMKNRLTTWIDTLTWDWCISRQRYFGIPFPIWYSKRPGEVGKILTPTFAQLPVNPMVDLPIGYTQAEVEPDCDVMDTWATSSISPQLTTHAIEQGIGIDYQRHAQLFPMDLRPQAHEIIRTWTFYTLLKAYLHEDKLPWKNIMIHGWCLAPDRHKMSKSKGNVILPETLLQQYGADVIRYWSANARLGADTCYCENTLKNGKRLVTKLWNAGKFIAQHFSKLPTALLTEALSSHTITHTLDQWLLQRLDTLIQEVQNHFLAYNYAEALLLTEKFFWSIFCDDYLEISKDRTYNQINLDKIGQQSAILTLYHTFYTLLQLFAPILPYITEELAQGLYTQRGSIHQQGNWPQPTHTMVLTQDQSDQVDCLREIVSLVRKAKAAHKISLKTPLQLLSIQAAFLPEALLQDLKNVTNAKALVFCRQIRDEVTIQMQGTLCRIGMRW